jgi:hypothetical protein
LEPGEQGVIMGALIFEVVTNLIPGGQLKHATKNSRGQVSSPKVTFTNEGSHEHLHSGA